MRRIFLILSVCFFNRWVIHAQIKTSSFLIPYKVGGLSGFCDTNRDIIIQPIYADAQPFKCGLAIVLANRRDSAKYGLIDLTGKLILPAEYDHIYTTDSGRTYMIKDSITTVRFPSGYLFVPRKYKVEYGFIRDLFVARYKKMVGVIDTNENIIIPFKYTNIGSVDDKGYSLAKSKNGRTRFIDEHGKSLISLKKNFILIASDFYDDRAEFMKKTKYGTYRYGFINRKGEISIPPIYERANMFSGGFAGVSNRERSSFINARGDSIAPFIYGSTGYFQDGYGDFSINGKCGLMDTSGKEILRVAGVVLKYVNRNFIIISKYDSIFNLIEGVIDIKGNELLPCKYQMIGVPENGIFDVIENERAYYMDLKFQKYIQD